MAHTRAYRVTYRIIGTEGAPIGVIRRGGPKRHPDGWAVDVQVTEGYSTLDSIPRIIALAHHPRRVDAESVEILTLALLGLGA